MPGRERERCMHAKHSQHFTGPKNGMRYAFCVQATTSYSCHHQHSVGPARAHLFPLSKYNCNRPQPIGAQMPSFSLCLAHLFTVVGTAQPPWEVSLSLSVASWDMGLPRRHVSQPLRQEEHTHTEPGYCNLFCRPERSKTSQNQCYTAVDQSPVWYTASRRQSPGVVHASIL